MQHFSSQRKPSAARPDQGPSITLADLHATFEDDAEARITLATLLTLANRHDDAERVLIHTLELHPDRALALHLALDDELNNLNDCAALRAAITRALQPVVSA